MIDPLEVASWIRLEQTPGVGNVTARQLLAHFGLPDNIFAASQAALSALVGLPLARALTAPVPVRTQDLIDHTLHWLQQPHHYFLTLADSRYPQTLLDIPDPPITLYVKGCIALLHMPSIAIVGSRNATAQGVLNAERFATSLSQAGFPVVSGLAMGIDAAAHAGALPHAGSTIAVIGTGIDIVYPARNRALAARIAKDGCVVSEYALGTGPLTANFPRRNRLISGLSRAVLVVEAAARSGSLITARVAAEQGRDVFAIPGSIHAPLSKGCHWLIKQGAKLVESAQDVLEEIAPAVPTQGGHGAAVRFVPPALEALLAALGFDPVDSDALVARTGLDVAALSAQLLELELLGYLEVLPGGNYRRVG
ncbi:MAG: DNA-protecting protein DprA [Oxalobacteraceae bacterium]|nr:DNA-protecting protein DprA [Oxalobacteraceae bacterium]